MIVAVIYTLLSFYILDNYLAKQYERIVLRPEITDTEIKEAYLLCVRDIHAQFVETVRKMEGDMLELLSTETNHLEDPTNRNSEKNDKNTRVLLQLDWASQLQKIKNVPANFEKTPELTVALSAGGALIGKTVGTAVAGKAAASTVGTKLVGGKLASPFVTKVCLFHVNFIQRSVHESKIVLVSRRHFEPFLLNFPNFRQLLLGQVGSWDRLVAPSVQLQEPL